MRFELPDLGEGSSVPLGRMPRLVARLDIVTRTMALIATPESRITSEIPLALP